MLASSVTLIAGQIAFTTLRSPLIRATIALLFAIPAADGWQQAVAVIDAIVVAATAWVRMAFSAPPDAGQGVAAGVPVPLTSVPKEG